MKGHCWTCGEPLLQLAGSAGIQYSHYCSRACRMMWAEFEGFSTLEFITTNSSWPGAPTEAEATREYFRSRMWEAVRRLPHSEDILVEVLLELIEEIAGAAAMESVTKRCCRTR